MEFLINKDIQNILQGTAHPNVYSKTLYFPKETFCLPCDGANDNDDDNDDDFNRDCVDCKKSLGQPNISDSERIKVITEDLKRRINKKEVVPLSFDRNTIQESKVLSKYCEKPIFTWLPHTYVNTLSCPIERTLPGNVKQKCNGTLLVRYVFYCFFVYYSSI